MTLQMVPIGALIEDFSIYPRHAVDSTHVKRIAQALRVGEKLPHIVVEKHTLRIGDGWHRARAYRGVYGADASIEVDVRDFKDQAEIIRFAVDANIRHGRRLDQVDRVRCAVLLQEIGLPPAQIALTLRVEESELERLRVRIAPVPIGAAGSVPGTNKMPLKRAAAHLAGKELTESQATAHASMPGTSLTLLARQLVTALRAGLVDPRNERLREALVELRTVLNVYLDTPEPV